MTRLLLALIRVYQRTLSPLLGDCCRFEPSCSRYAAACITHYGAFKGGFMALKRLLRCNPLFGGGIDMPPLPEGANEASIEPNWSRLSRMCHCGESHSGHVNRSAQLDEASR